jgi:hypothetical protein
MHVYEPLRPSCACFLALVEPSGSFFEFRRVISNLLVNPAPFYRDYDPRR